jgi:hypothetical protein
MQLTLRVIPEAPKTFTLRTLWLGPLMPRAPPAVWPDGTAQERDEVVTSADATALARVLEARGFFAAARASYSERTAAPSTPPRRA